VRGQTSWGAVEQRCSATGGWVVPGRSEPTAPGEREGSGAGDAGQERQPEQCVEGSVLPVPAGQGDGGVDDDKTVRAPRTPATPRRPRTEPDPDDGPWVLAVVTTLEVMRVSMMRFSQKLVAELFQRSGRRGRRVSS